MTRILICAALIVGALAAGTGYIIKTERDKCDARIAEAEAKFVLLQSHVKQVVEEYEKSVDIDKGDREDAAKLKETLARLSTAAAAKCTLDGTDVADAGRLRDGPRTGPK